MSHGEGDEAHCSETSIAFIAHGSSQSHSDIEWISLLFFHHCHWHDRAEEYAAACVDRMKLEEPKELDYEGPEVRHTAVPHVAART